MDPTKQMCILASFGYSNFFNGFFKALKLTKKFKKQKINFKDRYFLHQKSSIKFSLYLYPGDNSQQGHFAIVTLEQMKSC